MNKLNKQPFFNEKFIKLAESVHAFELNRVQDQLKVEFNLMLKSFQDKTRIGSSQKVQSPVMQYNKDFKIPVEIVTIARKVKLYIDFGKSSIGKSAILTFSSIHFSTSTKDV